MRFHSDYDHVHDADGDGGGDVAFSLILKEVSLPDIFLELEIVLFSLLL
jgi:hypothetical protein